MSIKDISSIKQFLVGEADSDDTWLHSVHSSVSSQSDFLCLGLNQRLVLLQAKYVDGVKKFVPSFQSELSVLSEDESISSVLCLPVISQGRANSSWNCAAVGFDSGFVRIYTDSGKLLVQKAFHTSPVTNIKVQTTPDSKHFTSVIYSQSVSELLLIYDRQVVTVSGTDLFETLTANRSELAMAAAQGLQFNQMAALPGTKLHIPEQIVADAESIVVQNTAYSQFVQITMRGGFIEERHKMVHTTPYFLTVGQEPYLQFNQPASLSNSTVALAQNMVSTVKSGFFRVASGAVAGFWGGGPAETSPEVKVDPSVKLAVCHSIKDENKCGLEVSVAPNKVYSVVKDAQNRVTLIDNYSGTALQVWRGYHHVQMAWSTTSWTKNSSERDPPSNVQVSILLLLYLPRRGLIEVWSPEQKSKVTEFHVSKSGLLLKSVPAVVDSGVPRRRETVLLQSAFLQPDGRIKHFYIPFHALSTSTSAEKDLKMQAKISDMMLEKRDEEGFIEELAGVLDEVSNPQLKSQIVTTLLDCDRGAEDFNQTEASSLIEHLLQSYKNKENISTEHKVFKSKLVKLKQLVDFYVAVNEPKSSIEPSTVIANNDECIQDVCDRLLVDNESVAKLFKILDLEAKEKEEKPMEVTLVQFLQCFETEGELTAKDDDSAKSVPVYFRKKISPRLQQSFMRTIFKLCLVEQVVALDHLKNSGISCMELFEMLLKTNLDILDRSVEHLDELHSMMQILSGFQSLTGRSARLGLQDIARRLLTQCDMSAEAYSLAFCWRNVVMDSEMQNASVYSEEWARIIHQMECFLAIKRLFYDSLDEEIVTRKGFSVASMFDSGNGRISEMIAKWLLKLGADTRTLIEKLDSDDSDDSVERTFVEKCGEYFPKSVNHDILILHMSWECLQRWSREREQLELIDSFSKGLISLCCPSVKTKFACLVWRSFFSKLLRDAARLTEEFSKVATNENSRCIKELGIERSALPGLLHKCSSMLDQQLELVGLSDESETILDYDCISNNRQLHLLDHIKSTALPDYDSLALEHQLASVLDLTWSLKLPSRPLQVFNSQEVNQLLQTQPGILNLFSGDYNSRVSKARVEFVGVAGEAAVGFIHRLAGAQVYDTTDFKRFKDQIMQLGKLWFMTDVVKASQVEALYRAGFDDLAGEEVGGIADQAALSSRLLEVGLLRLSKFVYSATDQGERLAAVPVTLVTQLASRRDMASAVADSSLAATAALLVKVCANVEVEDHQELATQALSAVQLLQVRKNRQQI